MLFGSFLIEKLLGRIMERGREKPPKLRMADKRNDMIFDMDLVARQGAWQWIGLSTVAPEQDINIYTITGGE